MVRDGERLHRSARHRVRRGRSGHTARHPDGQCGSIELAGDTRLVVRRAGEAPETVEFPAPPRKAPPPALSAFFAQVAEALRTGTQITPSFDDGVAVAHTMDRLRATAS